MSKLPARANAAKKGGKAQQQDKPKNTPDSGRVGLAAGADGAQPHSAEQVPGETAKDRGQEDPAQNGLEAVGQSHSSDPTPGAAAEPAMPELNEVEQVRKAIVRGQISTLMRLRGFISLTRGNQAAVEKLHGPSGNLIVAKVSDLILRELGHEADTPVEDSNNPTRRLLPSRHRVG